MYPREVVPCEKIYAHGVRDLLWFIVFKPCAATLLRGAVPVGRVMSCVKLVSGEAASTSDNSLQSFDATVLQFFKTYARAKPDETCASDKSYMQFGSFRPWANIAKWQTIAQSGNWEAAFDSHIACSLEECGYPRRQAEVASYEYIPSPAYMREYGVPPPAALTLLQTKARERILAYGLQTMRKYNMTYDVVMKFVLCHESNTGKDMLIRIRLDDKQFLHNAAHFRTAAQSEALGSYFHQCFVPSGQSPGTRLPFVTLHHRDHGSSCAQSPITLPDTDIVYGEYTAPAASENVTYPVGTVLMYPREVVPCEKIYAHGVRDLLWFIVFKPCAATLLRGAVPVGRVMSCVRGETASTSNKSAHPFDANVLQSFEANASPLPDQQCKSNGWYMLFDSFRPHSLHFEIFVKTLANKTITLVVDHSDTIETVK